ncbi:MAG: hypothetical protein OK439_00520 [Thaumarchaeota archaeon]|nr:hypothetical protein [Nitrososphaerota archaeon]
MKAASYDIAMAGCISLEVGLLLFLINEVFSQSIDIVFIFIIPVILFVVLAFVLQRNALFQSRKKGAIMLQMIAAGGEAEAMEPRIEKKPFKPSPAPASKPSPARAPNSEYPTHNCPEHGAEQCAGNYMNLHSCNEPSDSTKQIYWEEVSPKAPSKLKRRQ